MYCLFFPFIFYYILGIFLILVFELLGLPYSYIVNICGEVLHTCFTEIFSSFLQYRVKSLVVMVSKDCLDLGIILACYILIQSYYCSIIFYFQIHEGSSTFQMWRYILYVSTFLAHILFIHSCFLVILSRSCISSNFQSMISYWYCQGVDCCYFISCIKFRFEHQLNSWTPSGSYLLFSNVVVLLPLPFLYTCKFVTAPHLGKLCCH